MQDPLEEKYQRALDAAGIFPRFKDARISDCEWMEAEPEKRKALQHARELSTPDSEGEFYIEKGESQYRSILFSGSFGTGKTYLATGTLKRMLWHSFESDPSRMHGALWSRFLEYVNQVQSTYSPQAEETSRQVIQRYKSAELLLLDDVGHFEKGAETHDRRELFEQVVDYRNDHFRNTIITTNLSPEQIREQFGDRALERLKEMAFFVRLEGTNLRDSKPFQT